MAEENFHNETNNSLDVGGDVKESNIIVGQGNTLIKNIYQIFFPNSPLPTKKHGLRFFIEMSLGGMLPMFGCLIIFIGSFSRHLLEDRWVSGVTEIIVTSIIFSGLLIVGFVLFVVGLGRLMIATMDTLGKAAKSDYWWYPFKAVWNLGSSWFSNRDEFFNQFEKIKNSVGSLKINGNWLDSELKERFIASLISLFIPGLGLYIRGRKWLGGILFVFTIIGYGEFIPGLLLHLLAVVLSGSLEKPRTVIGNENPLAGGDGK